MKGPGLVSLEKTHRMEREIRKGNGKKREENPSTIQVGLAESTCLGTSVCVYVCVPEIMCVCVFVPLHPTSCVPISCT